ncbi:hypothetical protein [Desulfosarcina ovata]|uniref:hypothetical protein n=1 Tax=Desulfosarcina ovata TaxID=83564 RepID=UPI0012D2F250|nr:hypothetical protein [Desulfosarcina ovata]
MEPVLCLNCYDFFPPSPRHKNQSYCMKPECRRAKKAAWKRAKMQTDPQFRKDQQLSNKKWVQNNPGFWRRYRKRNPEKTERNRILQRIRNQRRRAKRQKTGVVCSPLIAKVDASIPNRFGMVGQFWLVPVIAKVDPLKVNIVEIPMCYQ